MKYAAGRTAFIILILASLMLLGSCDLFTSPDEGSLVISMGGMGRNIWEPEAGDMVIRSYKIILEGPGSFGTITVVRNTADNGSTYILEGLRAGNYVLRIEGYNQEDAQGDQIAALTQRDDNGTPVRNIALTIRRSRVQTVNAVLVPHVDDVTGSLEITEIIFRGVTDEDAFNKKLLQNNPRVIIEMHHLGEKNLNETSNGSYIYGLIGSSALSAVRGEQGENSLFSHNFILNDGQGPDDIGDEINPALTVISLPAGWYSITTELQSDITSEEGTTEVRIWKTIALARILGITDGQESKPTRGSITVRDTMLETGGFELEIEHDMDLLVVEIAGDESVDITEGSETVEFSVSGEYANPFYLWHVNGDMAGGNSSTLEYTFTEAGRYSVTVMVHDNGSWGADTVIFDAFLFIDEGYEIGEKAQGGILFYDKGYYGDGWRYLEVYEATLSDNGTESFSWVDAGTLCASHEVEEYDDWRLPSKDELVKVYENLHQDGVEFPEAYYWSLDEFNNEFAWAMSFIDGFQVSTGEPVVNNQYAFSKDSLRQVLAVRAF